MQQSIVDLLKRLWNHIGSRRRRQCGLLLVLMLFASFAEILSIGAVIPFLGVLTAPERIFGAPLAQPLIQLLGFTEPQQLLLPLTIGFAAATLLAGGMRLLLLWVSTRWSFAVGADLSIDIYRRTLYQSYTVHCSRNSSEVINGISGKADGVIYSIILPVLTLISSSVMLIAILAALLMMQPVIALTAVAGFCLIYLGVIRVTRKQILSDGQCVARETTQVIKSLQEGLGGIRDVLIDASQETYCQIYRNADLPLRRAQGNILFISNSPRYAMEALGMLLISLLAYSLAQQAHGVAMAIPILGALALGAQRMLPVLQQAYVSWTYINSGLPSLVDTLELLDQPLPDYANQLSRNPLLFNSSISLQQVGFSYDLKIPHILKLINLDIKRGSRVGFIGSTGSGKSTLLDIVMGLLEPTEGELKIDGQNIKLFNNRDWQAHIAHVPQSIFLADGTIEENIAFGVPKALIDHDQVRKSAQRAQIATTIEGWSKQYETLVGERGIRLSGGQRQRIGIARALYKQANVIIFDEATSALDSETEEAVMKAIDGLSDELTLLIVAHRLTTLKNCTQIVELADGFIKRVGNYEDIINQSIIATQTTKEI
jgi:ATP-binding cassette subfamily B protein